MMMDTNSNSAKNVKQSAKAIAESVELSAPVTVTIIDDLKVHQEFRGAEIRGFWKGVSPVQGVHPAIRDQENGWHWIAHVVDPRNDDLVYDIHLAIISSIDVAPEKVRQERET